jgi:outer membrane protein assembly factor BamB
MKRWRGSVLATLVAMTGLFGASAAQATVAVTASVNVHTKYLGDTTNTTYTFTVTNSSTASESIGSVQITAPNNAWVVQGCGLGPSGWSRSGVMNTCTFSSAAGTADNVAPGATAHFHLVAQTAAGSADVRGVPWTLSVNQADSYTTTGAVSATPTTTGALTTNIYTWQVTSAIVRHDVSAFDFGTPCPPAQSGAAASSTVVIVLCGTNHSDVNNLQPQAANSPLSGTLLAKHGTFSSGAIPTSPGVVVAEYSGSKVTSTAGSGLTLVAKVGSSSTQTSPKVTLTGYTAAPLTSWRTFRHDNVHSGVNPSETLVGLSNVNTLGQWWTQPTGSYVDSSPSVVSGTVYVGSEDGKLYALNAATGVVRWTAATGNGIESSPAVVNGVVYVASADDKLYAFAANGTTNCSGTPTTCQPLWTATLPGQNFSSPAVANGVVYVGSVDGLYAFDANGVTNCSGAPVTCTPLWAGPTGGRIFSSSPAVANGKVYVGAWDDKLYAFDATGSTGCSGVPKTCSPLWTATTGNIIQSSPAVANGVVYIGSQDDKLYAFSAAGTTSCSGSPKTCAPLWTATTGGIVDSSPAVANGVVYVGSGDGYLYAFDAAGTTDCSGTPTTCSALWTGQPGGAITSSPTIANGVVYVGTGSGQVVAWDASGTVGCSGTPTTCNAIWGTNPLGGIVQSSPTVVNGNLYVGNNSSGVYAFGLP